MRARMADYADLPCDSPMHRSYTRRGEPRSGRSGRWTEISRFIACPTGRDSRSSRAARADACLPISLGCTAWLRNAAARRSERRLPVSGARWPTGALRRRNRGNPPAGGRRGEKERLEEGAVRPAGKPRLRSAVPGAACGRQERASTGISRIMTASGNNPN